LQAKRSENTLRSNRISLFITGVIMIGVLALVAGNALPAASDSGDSAQQQATVDAAVNAAFTQTAEAAQVDTEATNAAQATLDFESTVNAAISATLTATFLPSTATEAPTIAPTNTPTPIVGLSVGDATALQTALIFTDTDGTIEALDIKGDLVASGGSSGIVYLWDINSGNVLFAMPHSAPIRGIAFNPGAPELITTDTNGQVYRWDTNNGSSLPLTGQPVIAGDVDDGGAIPVGFAADGSQFATFDFDGTVTVWTYPDVTPASTESGLSFTRVDFDNGVIVTTRPEVPNLVSIARANAETSVALPDTVSYAEPTVLNADASRVIVTTDIQTNYVIDTVAGSVLFDYPVTGFGLSSFNPDGTLIADIDETGTVILRNAENGNVVQTLAGHTGAGYETLFTQNGTRLLSIGDDGTVRVWARDVTEAPLEVVAALPRPLGPTPLPPGFPPVTQAEVQVAEQVYERGRMFWVQPVNQIWVMTTDEDGRGVWLVYEDTFDESVDLATDEAFIAPEGFFTPERGFGKLWRENPEVQDALGWALTPEFGYVSPYRYVPGGEMQEGTYVPGPGYHILFSLAGEEFRFNEDSGTWQLGEFSQP
jgi:WD40 repeat protein